MSRRLSTSLVLCLCVFGTGIQWDALQAFAWGRMLANYARTETVAAAVAHTFDGRMCRICRMVAAAKKQAQSSPAAPIGKIDAKILLFFQPAAPLIAEASEPKSWAIADRQTPARERALPPLPPPRTAGA